MATLVVSFVASAQNPRTDDTANSTASRQDEVRAAGAQVMPFALDQTQHVFDKTADGGIQRVRVRGDAPGQVARIRSHLSEIARAFAAHDFSKPAHIHGADMPGLAELRAAKPGELDVVYRELADGAEIEYAGHTPAVIDAVHRWFDAQLGDHGKDAATTTALHGLDDLSWLAGTWIIDNGGQRTEEFWSEPAADLMVGMSRTVRDGRTVSFEFMRIARRGDGVFYIAQPRGRPPVEFPLSSWNGSEAVFTNPGNGDHLSRIVYRRNADGSLTARIEGSNDGRSFAEEYPYRRVGPGVPAT